MVGSSFSSSLSRRSRCASRHPPQVRHDHRLRPGHRSDHQPAHVNTSPAGSLSRSHLTTSGGPISQRSTAAHCSRPRSVSHRSTPRQWGWYWGERIRGAGDLESAGNGGNVSQGCFVREAGKLSRSATCIGPHNAQRPHIPAQHVGRQPLSPLLWCRQNYHPPSGIGWQAQVPRSCMCSHTAAEERAAYFRMARARGVPGASYPRPR